MTLFKSFQLADWICNGFRIEVSTYIFTPKGNFFAEIKFWNKENVYSWKTFKIEATIPLDPAHFDNLKTLIKSELVKLD